MKAFGTLTCCALLVLGCAAPQAPDAQPSDLSALQHDAMARGETRKAEIHDNQYEPMAGKHQRCGGEGAVCWASARNPTNHHRREAEHHRNMAADHRAASRALRDAEAQACAGIPEEDRDMSPFDHREDIARVEPLQASIGTEQTPSTRMAGASIFFNAVPGMTVAWLQHEVDCHLARNAALGHDVPEMAYCPLVPEGVSAIVTATTDGFAVAVRADNPDTAKEVLRRAQSLVAQ